MSGKRLFHDGAGDDHERPNHQDTKRLKRTPSFAKVIQEAMLANALQNLLTRLEPMLRKVVHEEVEKGLVHGARTFIRSPRSQRPPQLQAPVPESPPKPSLQLRFVKPLKLPIFTGTKIKDVDGNPPQLVLERVDPRQPSTSASQSPAPLAGSLKVEIVVVDGAFPVEDRDDGCWTTEELERNVVRERTGRRPLVVGGESLVIREVGGEPVTISGLTFTDNSSWIKSRNFRIAARVASGASRDGLRVKEALTEKFMVKDHRGELYRKHFPPKLGDEVWRLKKIGKDGAFHKKLSAEGIITVQDFLKLLTIDENRLRTILGPGMSDKVWDLTIEHARSCNLGTKFYLFRLNPYSGILLNPVCQLQGIVLNGCQYLCQQLSTQQRSIVHEMTMEAYNHWHALEEIEEPYATATLLSLIPNTVNTIQQPFPDNNDFNPGPSGWYQM